LIGVDLIDILDDGILAYYFFMMPYLDISQVYITSLLSTRIASVLDLDWIYLGYG